MKSYKICRNCFLLFFNYMTVPAILRVLSSWEVKMQIVNFRQNKTLSHFFLISASLILLLFITPFSAFAEDKSSIDTLRQMVSATLIPLVFLIAVRVLEAYFSSQNRSNFSLAQSLTKSPICLWRAQTFSMPSASSFSHW